MFGAAPFGDLPFGDAPVADLSIGALAQSAPIGYWLGPDDTATVADVVAHIMNGIGGWAGFRRDGRLEVQIFRAPTGVYEASFDRSDIFAITREQLPSGLSPPPWRWRVPYQRNWTVQTDLAGSVSADRKAIVTNPYRLAESASTQIQTDHPLAQDPAPVDAYYSLQSDAQAEADRRLALFKKVRGLYRMTLPRKALTLRLGAEIKVTYPRWDLSVGKTMIVVEISENLTAPQQGTIDTVEVVAYG